MPHPEPAAADLVVDSSDEAQTRAFAACVARHLRGGELLGLRGDLGTGKTAFVRGLAEGLGIPPGKVRSPTFTLVNTYAGGRLPLAHLDLYRIAPTPFDRLALREVLYGEGVCVVEWFERLGEEAEHLGIDFTFVGEERRRLVVSACGARYKKLLEKLAFDWRRG